MSKLLVVDDESSICWGISRMAQTAGHEVMTASSAEQALDLVSREVPDVVVLDVRLPGMSGLEAIPLLRERVSNAPIIVMTAYGDLPTAVEAVRQGAFQYVLKPFELAQIEAAITSALRSPLPMDRHVWISEPNPSGIVGKTHVMQRAFERIALAAASDACVLITGETGTGKELAARAIHAYGARANQPFVAVNVAALSPSLAESELFGHVRGAFTGADRPREGLLVQAHGGTLFLDEVADIPLALQVKLLRVLDCGELNPVGSGAAVRSDFRVVSATNQDLLERVEAGSFRHDLYFRLCAFRIDLPPLRERREDVPELARHFVERLAAADAKAPSSIMPATMTELMQRPWFGNVRELRNAIEHAMIVARGGPVLPEHLPPPIAATVVGGPAAKADFKAALAVAVQRWAAEHVGMGASGEAIYEQLLEVVEPPLFRAVLEKHRGQCAAAARQLGLHRTTLRKKLDQYGISDAR